MITQKICPFPSFDILAQEADGNAAGGHRAFEMIMSMKKLDIAAIRWAFDGAA